MVCIHSDKESPSFHKRVVLVRWIHRWGGLVAALFLVVLSVTGITLNHLDTHSAGGKMGVVRVLYHDSESGHAWFGTSSGVYRQSQGQP